MFWIVVVLAINAVARALWRLRGRLHVAVGQVDGQGVLGDVQRDCAALRATALPGTALSLEAPLAWARRG